MNVKSKNNENHKNKKCKKNGRISIISLLEDERANFSIIMAGLMLIGFLILSIAILNVAIDKTDENRQVISSDEFQYAMDDYMRNVPIIEREALEELGEDVRPECCRMRPDI